MTLSTLSSSSESRSQLWLARLQNVLKPKTATCLRNQSSLLIDHFKSSFCSVTDLLHSADDGDDDNVDDGDDDNDDGGDFNPLHNLRKE